MRYYRASALMVQVLGPSAASQHVHVDFTASRFSNLTCKALTELQKEFGFTTENVVAVSKALLKKK